MDWHKLIAEVEKRPYLWKTPKGERHCEKLDILWKEVSENVGFSASKCKARWTYLRFMYVRLKKRADKNASYVCIWEYWEHLRFLDDRMQHSKETSTLNVHEMIAKIKERPYLWKVPRPQRNLKKAARLWNEVADHVGVNVNICREKWKKLCTTHKKRMETDPSTHRKWEFCKDLKFLDVIYEGPSTSKRVEIDKWDLIAKVKERPHLWQVPFHEKNFNITASLWKEITDSLGADEAKCKQTWQTLRSRYGRHKKLFESSKEYECRWQYYDALKFLDGIPKTNDDAPEVKIDKYDLITLVKIRPELWKIERKENNFRKVAHLWEEIGEILGVDANVCKNHWGTLRYSYKKNRKQESTENEECKWEYYEHLKFLDAVQDNGNNDTDNIDRYVFITKVKERPELWRGSADTVNKKYEIECLWKEISELLDINYDKCRKMWKNMLNLYKSNKKAEEMLLESSKKYYSKWEHYEHLKFLDDVDYKIPDRYALIAKVKQIPKLWKANQNQNSITSNIWKEIAEYLGVHEQTCINIWTDLRLLFFNHKERRDKLLEENPSATYKCSFEYFDDLKFLDEEALNSGALQEFQLHKLKLINTIKERPYLWKTEPKDRNKLILNYYWSQVKESLGLTEKQCIKEWDKLCSLYNEEKRQIEMLKQKEVVDESSVGRWEYFEYMKFLDSGISDQSSDDDDDADEDQDLHSLRRRIIMINEIQKSTPLWKNPKNTVKVLNAHLWSEVSKKCGIDVKTCKQKWCNVRVYYRNKYNLFKENKIGIEAFRKCPNYDYLQFLNEYIDKEDNQQSNSADTEEDLSNTQLESVCVKEEPEMQSASFTNIPLKIIQGTSIKEEMEFMEQDTAFDDISVKIEDTGENQLIEDAPESQQQYIWQEIAPTQSEELKFEVKEEPSTDDIFIKEEFEINFLEQQANQLENIENAQVKVEQDIEISDSLVPVKLECLKVDSCIANWVKNTDDSDSEFMKDSAGHENGNSFPIWSQLENKNIRNAQLDNSLKNSKQDKIELSTNRKPPRIMTNESKVMKKRRKQNN